MHINIQADTESNCIYIEISGRSGLPILVFFTKHEFHEIREYISQLMPGVMAYVEREDDKEEWIDE